MMCKDNTAHNCRVQDAAGEVHMERQNHVAAIEYRNICAEYGLETPTSHFETPSKVVENDQVKTLWDFQIQTDRMVMANQADIVVVDKEQRKAQVADLASFQEKGT